MSKRLYCLVNKKTGRIVNQTHLMLLKNDAEATFMYLKFMQMMRRIDIELHTIGYYTYGGFVIESEPTRLLSIDNVIEFVLNLDDDTLESVNLDKNIITNAFNELMDTVRSFDNVTADNVKLADTIIKQEKE